MGGERWETEIGFEYFSPHIFRQLRAIEPVPGTVLIFFGPISVGNLLDSELLHFLVKRRSIDTQ